MRKFPSTRTTCKKGETGRGMLLAAHCRADLVTGCEKEKNTNIIRWLSVSFFGRKWMSIFVFGRKWNFLFVGIFVYGRKWKKECFRSASGIHYKKVLVLVLVLKKSLDYITDFHAGNCRCRQKSAALQRRLWVVINSHERVIVVPCLDRDHSNNLTEC